MHLLFLNHNLREHGTYFRAFPIARELVRRGHTATLWTVSPSHWYRSVRETIEGVTVVETPSWNPFVGRDDGWGPLDILWRSLKIPSGRFDLVYAFAHPPNVALPALLGRMVGRIPLVVDWCDVYRDGIFPLRRKIRSADPCAQNLPPLQRIAERIEARMEHWFPRRADGVTVISSYLENEALQSGVERGRIFRFPSGANLDAIRRLDKADCRAELRARGVSLNDDAPVLGYVANYNPDERFFLAALKEVFARHPGARLLARCPEFTPSVVRECGVGGNIITLGRCPFGEIEGILGAADILLLPLDDNISNRGRWPNKFGDYLAAGRPVASCAIGDVADYFPQPGSATVREEIGVLTRCDSADYARGILELIATGDRHEAMGAAGRRLAERELAWPALSLRVEEFLSTIIRRHGRKSD